MFTVYVKVHFFWSLWLSPIPCCCAVGVRYVPKNNNSKKICFKLGNCGNCGNLLKSLEQQRRHTRSYAAKVFIIQPCNIGNLSNVGNLWWFYPVPPIKVIIITSFQKPCDFGINYGNPVSRTYLLWQLEKILVMSVTLVTMVTFRGVRILSWEKTSLTWVIMVMLVTFLFRYNTQNILWHLKICQ